MLDYSMVIASQTPRGQDQLEAPVRILGWKSDTVLIMEDPKNAA
jgi:hypothetical protein